MRRRGTAVAVVALALGVSLTAAGTATAASFSRSFQSSGVTVRAVASVHRAPPDLREVTRLRVYRNEVLLVDERPRPACECPVAAVGTGSHFIHVRQLDATPDPEVYLDLFTGGAHCCGYDLFLAFRPDRQTYGPPLVHLWGNAFYRLRFLDGGSDVPQFVSADDRFAYLFGSYAESRFPPRIWAYESGAMSDVTAAFPAVVRKNALRMRREYSSARGRQNVRPILAAFVADESLLGRPSRGFRLVRRALERGDLARQRLDVGGPFGRKYIGALRRVLRRFGYLRSAGVRFSGSLPGR